MSDVLKKVKALIQWGRQSKSTDDSGRDQVAQVESTGSKPFPVVYMYPYGMSANAPVECNVVQMNVGGSAKAKVGIPTMMENRFRDLEEWEVVVGNYKTKAKVYLNDDGQIVIEPKSEVVISGGTEPVIKGTTFATKYDTHTHATAFGPSGTTSAPTDSTCFNEKALV